MIRSGSIRSLHAKAREDRGFSLIEVLLTLFFLSMISTLIVYGMRGGSNATERARRLGEQSEIWAVQRYLRAAINGAQTLPLPGSISVMNGELNRLTFVTSHTVAGQFGGFYVTTISTRPNSEKPEHSDLWIEQTLFHRHGNYFGEARDVMPRSNVLRGITGLELRYFGVLENGEAPGWSLTWDDASRLPELVEIYVDFGDGDHRIWPMLAVATAIRD